MGRPLGTRGPLSWDPLGIIFFKRVILNVLSPRASPYLQMQQRPPKNFKKFQWAVAYHNGQICSVE